jgi:uncharacterized protein
MAVKNMLIGIVLFGSVLTFSNGSNKSESESQSKEDAVSINNFITMNSYISIFEIPAVELSRAVAFYQGILGIEIEEMDMPEMQMGIFPYEGQMVTGVIIKAEGYRPSSNGVTVYLNGGDNLQVILDNVEKWGGKILTPKTLHADGSGYFALFLDSEGNKIGLHSPN